MTGNPIPLSLYNSMMAQSSVGARNDYIAQSDEIANFHSVMVAYETTYLAFIVVAMDPERQWFYDETIAVFNMPLEAVISFENKTSETLNPRSQVIHKV